MQSITEKNECCKNFSNLRFIESEKVDELFVRTVYSCKVCSTKHYGKLNEILPDSQSFKIIEELNKKGISLDTLIIGGKSAIKFLIPDVSKLIEKTREIAKTKKTQCKSHSITDIFVDEKGIFCTKCGLRLLLVPAWVLGQSQIEGSDQD